MKKKIIVFAAVFLLLVCSPLLAVGTNLSVASGAFTTGMSVGADVGKWTFETGFDTTLLQVTAIGLKDGQGFVTALKTGAFTGLNLSAKARHTLLSFGTQRLSAGVYASLIASCSGPDVETPIGLMFPSTGLTFRWEGGYGRRGGMFLETSVPLAFTLLLTDFETIEGGLPVTLFQLDSEGIRSVLTLSSVVATKIGYTWHF